jgi:hypothetical protein
MRSPYLENLMDQSTYNSIPIPKRVEDRPTEDDLAQTSLGGPKGSLELPTAPMTKREQNLPNDEPGHVVKSLHKDARLTHW